MDMVNKCMYDQNPKNDLYNIRRHIQSNHLHMVYCRMFYKLHCMLNIVFDIRYSKIHLHN